LAYDVKELTSETWQGFETLFARHKGVRGGCWCTFHLCTSTQYWGMTWDQRREFQAAAVAQGRSHGLLVYDAGVPIAWCQYGPATDFRQFDRMRAYSKLALPAELAPRWRISCIFVDKHRRGEGLSHVALSAAVASMRKHGGGIVESFPLVVPGARRPQYTGSVAMYEREGFREVARLGERTVLMRLVADE
jgi:GNAT superfamily N-acetyltransferase